MTDDTSFKVHQFNEEWREELIKGINSGLGPGAPRNENAVEVSKYSQPHYHRVWHGS